VQLIVIGKILGYPEKETWRMTLKKLLGMWHEYRYLMGYETRRQDPDDVIPGEDVI
jgi:hypothetical protein